MIRLKKYVGPEIEIMEFEVEDVITTSSGAQTDETVDEGNEGNDF